MRLFLIRHGQTESNVNRLLDTAHPGAPLNETGRRQAESLVHRLADEPIKAIYASTLTRAQQTAEPLARDRGLEVQVIDGIQEISAGVEEMNSDWSVYVGVLESWSPTNLDVGIDGGETAREFVTRYAAAVAAIEAAGHDVAALVSHGAALRVFALTVQPDIPRASAPQLDNTEWITLEGSTDEGWRVVQWASNVFV
jgi:broad specificity phosphatase PhoE